MPVDNVCYWVRTQPSNKVSTMTVCFRFSRSLYLKEHGQRLALKQAPPKLGIHLSAACKLACAYPQIEDIAGGGSRYAPRNSTFAAVTSSRTGGGYLVTGMN